MKIMKWMLISFAVSILSVNVAFADNYTSTLRVEGTMLHLSLDDVSAPTAVRILDAEGFAWVEETIAGTGQYRKVFKLESLPAGTYTLIIKSDVQEIVQPITLSGKELIMDESKRAEYFRADVSQKRETVKLSLLNPTRKVVRFVVLSSQGRIQYQDTIMDQAVIDKHYDLKHLPAGKYTVFVDNGRETLSRVISLR